MLKNIFTHYLLFRVYECTQPSEPMYHVSGDYIYALQGDAGVLDGGIHFSFILFLPIFFFLHFISFRL